jgi:type VI secretion system protein ImpM
VQVGLYGKLPSHGDFLRRRASDDFVDAWDAWLQECVAASRDILGNDWLDVYLTSPAWRFVCAARACGPAAVMGLLVPSVDRVGRYFPLTLVAELPGHSDLLSAAIGAASFFENAERLVVDTLAADHVDFEAFDEQVSDLSDDLTLFSRPQEVALEPSAASVLNQSGEVGWHLPIESPRHLAPVFTQLLSHRLSELYEPLSLWWTEGSSDVRPSCLIAKGLPRPERFAALLDGSWAARQWRPVAAQVSSISTLLEPLVPDSKILRYRSVAASDVGCSREVNQDAFLERPETGLWVVADGLGGHSDGHVASRMVCDALADFEPSQSLDDTVAAARDRLRQVNDHLLRTSARSLLADRIGSTVVVLLVRGLDCAVLWAGDSRVYRFRDNRLLQLTRDHSAAVPAGLAGQSSSNVVTRAVGVAGALELDLYRDQVRPGDRFLLCSDGLTRMVPDDQIQAWIAHEDIDVAVEGLIRTTLEAGAPDNVTAVIAEARTRAPDAEEHPLAAPRPIV